MKWRFWRRSKRIPTATGVDAVSGSQAKAILRRVRAEGSSVSRAKFNAAANAFEAAVAKKPLPKSIAAKTRNQRLADVLRQLEGSDAYILKALKTQPDYKASLVQRLRAQGLGQPEELIIRIIRKFEKGKTLSQIIQEIE